MTKKTRLLLMALIDKQVPTTKWQGILERLKNKGWSQAAIAEHCKVSQNAINLINTGATRDPRHSLGENLIKLSRRRKMQMRKN